MSMPKIEIDTIKIEDALVNLIVSVALEEAAIAHILNAEGEKIQAVLNAKDTTIDQITSANKSVGDILIEVIQIEKYLKEKADVAVGLLSKTAVTPNPPVPPTP